jgi:hypothetical protein
MHEPKQKKKEDFSRLLYVTGATYTQINTLGLW